MRFRAPRSVSPSPVRGKPRSSSTFGIQSDSDSEEYDSELESSQGSYDDTDSDDASSVASTSSSSSSSFDLVADINKLSLRPRHVTHTPLEQRQIDDTVAAIRLRAHYTDPYEEWEKQTRKDAFKTARKALAETQTKLHMIQERKETMMEQRFTDHCIKQQTATQQETSSLYQKIRDSEVMLKAKLKQRNDELWKRIEAVIKAEEDKVAAQLEEERKIKEEEERKRKDAELKKRLAAEKQLQEEAERKKIANEKKRVEEEQERQEKEESEAQKRIEQERSKREEEDVELRRMLNFSTQSDEWRMARTDLYNLKFGPLKHVKANKELRAEWGRLRRQIVPKIGQLTNDAESISRISQQLIEILRPTNRPPHNEAIYVSLCSSLAKTFLLQAETEVTAEKRSAIPLAQVAFNLLETLEHFPSIFFSKLVQRCGGWPIPLVVPSYDIDELPWNSRDDRVKASGIRKSTSGEGLETTEEYSNRVSAMMRLYFHILKIRPVNQPLHPMFQLPRYWTWFARITNDPRLLQDPVASQLIYTGLDVLGLAALNVWGQQWVKMLALIHQGITEGYENGKLIGGVSAEGAAARTRVMLSLENIMNGVES